MAGIILQLKKLNAAYLAALEYDYCPSSEEAENISELYQSNIPLDILKECLDENQGRRPDEIVSEMSNLIKQL